jgi:hypothetical protein
VVETHYQHPRITTLLGEVDLCLIWEKMTFATNLTSDLLDGELNAWHDKWKHGLERPSIGMTDHFPT